MSTLLAAEVIRCCRALALSTEEPGRITRRFLSPPTRDVHATLTSWMHRLGMEVRVDPAGNLRGVYHAPSPRDDTPRLFIGSHLDTVPDAGAFDGVLGVVLGVALVESLEGRRCPFDIEVIGFSDEEGVRFGVPFIGSRAFTGSIDQQLLGIRDAAGRSVSDAIGDYDLDPARIGDAAFHGDAIGYVELHIEQGPVLDALDLPLASVGAIVGQSRMDVVFMGAAAHAGATPMNARRDAVAGTAEWIVAVERDARETAGLVATVGRIDAEPGASNVVPGVCRASLDVRHASDGTRRAAAARAIACARDVASRRKLEFSYETRLDQDSVPMNEALTGLVERSMTINGFPRHRMGSGAGHDAMIVAGRMPAAMLFLRSPGGISHHPDETVREQDVAAALAVGRTLLDEIARSRA